MQYTFQIQTATINLGVQQGEVPAITAMEQKPALQEPKRALAPRMKMSKRCYGKTLDILSRLIPEAGGLLLGPKDEPAVITHFIRDEHGISTPTSFTLAAGTLNEVLHKYVDCEMDCKGIAHSHPPGVIMPSKGDLAYVSNLFAADSSLDRFFMPIVCENLFYPYVVKGDGRVYRAELVLF